MNNYEVSKVKNTTSKISFGIGSDISLYKDQQSYLLLTADFTMLFKVFFIEANYDFIAGATDLFSVIPGVHFDLFSGTTVQIGCGIGIPIGYISLVPAVKIEHELTKDIAFGFEFKSPLGSSHVKQIHANMNFVFLLH